MNSFSHDRRQFVKAATLSSAAAAMATCNSFAFGKEAAAIPIIDTHQHLWNLEKFKLPWLSSAPAIYRHSYMTKEYAAAAQGLNVAKAVYMEVDVDPSQQVAEAEMLSEICRSKESFTAAAVVSGRPGSEQFKSYITRFKDSPYIKGIRQVLHAPETKPGTCLEPAFIRGIQLLGELGKSFDLCMRPLELGDGVKLADLCPGTRFIVDHCGNADPQAFQTTKAHDAQEKPGHDVESWKRDMGKFAQQKNVMCKISGIVVRAPKEWKADDLAPIVNFCLNEFGPDRVLFGSDWPVCLARATYRQWVEALLQIIGNRPDIEQRKLLHDNAVRFYGLT